MGSIRSIQFNPGTIKPWTKIITYQCGPDRKKTMPGENAVYVSDGQKLTKKVSLNYELRYSHFQRFGNKM